MRLAAVAERWWPGPLTLVVLRRRAARRSTSASRRRTVGLRVPGHDLRAGGGGRGRAVATTSANRHGEPTPATAAEAATRARRGRSAVVVDGGPLDGRGSTVIDATRSLAGAARGVDALSRGPGPRRPVDRRRDLRHLDKLAECRHTPDEDAVPPSATAASPVHWRSILRVGTDRGGVARPRSSVTIAFSVVGSVVVPQARRPSAEEAGDDARSGLALPVVHHGPGLDGRPGRRAPRRAPGGGGRRPRPAARRGGTAAAGGSVPYTPKACLVMKPPLAVTSPTLPGSSRSTPAIVAMRSA